MRFCSEICAGVDLEDLIYLSVSVSSSYLGGRRRIGGGKKQPPSKALVVHKEAGRTLMMMQRRRIRTKVQIKSSSKNTENVSWTSRAIYGNIVLIIRLSFGHVGHSWWYM